MTKDKIDFPMHVNQWKETSGNMADYCRANEISYQTFMYHASRMKKKEIVSMEPKEFIRIDVAEKNMSGIEYHFTNVVDMRKGIEGLNRLINHSTKFPSNVLPADKKQWNELSN